MGLITQNLDDNKSKFHPFNKIERNKKTVYYSSASEYRGNLAVHDNINLSNKTRDPLKEYTVKQQISFKGFLPKGFKNFVSSKEKALAKDLLSDITRYIAPEDENLVHVLVYNVNNEKHGIANEFIHTNEPFFVNVIKAFMALPKFIIINTKRVIGDDNTRKRVKDEMKRENTRHKLLGFWMHVDKHATNFDKGITGENLDELKTILQKGNEEQEKALLAFFKDKKLESLYSKDEDSGKISGILTKSDEKGNFFKGFVEELSGKVPENKEDSVIEKVKKEYVQERINKTIVDKQGSFLPSYSQTWASFMARIVSGTIPAWFIAHDFYNLRILNSNDKKEAKKEWKSKFKQETGRIAIDAYQGYLLNSIFERLTNRSLPFAMSLNIVNCIGANVFSRLATNRPVLPISVNKAMQLKNTADINKAEHVKISATENNFVVNNKIKQLNTYKSFKNNNSSISFGAKGSGVIKSLQSKLKNLDDKFAEATPLKWSLEKFKESYERVNELDEKDARKMIEIAANEMKIDKNKSELTIDVIAEEAKKANDKVIIGNNWVYRYSREIINIIKFPYDFALVLRDITRTIIINPVRKLLGKKPLKSNKNGGFHSEQFIKNVTKWANKVNDKVGVVTEKNIEEAKGRYADKKDFFSTKFMEYGANELSTGMKLTGFVTVPFLATDAYNVTLGETKDKDFANTKTKQRAIQDSSRQGISLWISYAFNQMGKVLSNANLLGNAIVIAVSAFSYEALTRIVVGQPLLPTSHEKMVEAEKERAKSKNWFVKLMAGRLKTNSATNLASTTIQKTGSVNNSNLSSSGNNLNSAGLNINVSELQKKFLANLN